MQGLELDFDDFRGKWMDSLENSGGSSAALSAGSVLTFVHAKEDFIAGIG
jgi:hypothetical protein